MWRKPRELCFSPDWEEKKWVFWGGADDDKVIKYYGKYDTQRRGVHGRCHAHIRYNKQERREKNMICRAYNGNVMSPSG